MDYGLVIIFSGILFLLINAAPIAGAVMLAKKIADNLFLNWSLAGAAEKRRLHPLGDPVGQSSGLRFQPRSGVEVGAGAPGKLHLVCQ